MVSCSVLGINGSLIPPMMGILWCVSKNLILPTSSCRFHSELVLGKAYHPVSEVRVWKTHHLQIMFQGKNLDFHILVFCVSFKNVHIYVSFLCKFPQIIINLYVISGYFIAMEAMAHRNRWFTELKNGDFPWQTVSHNPMVISRCSIYVFPRENHGTP